MIRITDIFRRRNPQTVQATVTGSPSAATSWGTDPWSNDLLRSGVDSIARVGAKLVLTPTAVFRDGSTAPCDPELTRLLQAEPNPLMSAYDYLYMTIAQVLVRGNAFSYVQRDSQGRVSAIWPLHYASVDMRQDGGGYLYAAFTFRNGKSGVVPYDSILHLRRHFYDSDVMGSDQSPLASAVRLAESQNRSIEATARTSGQIRGLLTFNGALAADERDKLRKRFESDFLAEGSSGVVITDSTAAFEPMTSQASTVSGEDQTATRTKLFSYLGINQSIVDSTFTDDDFAAFDESIIESLALQIAQEYGRKIYPGRSDRRIDVSSARISYLSPSTVVRVFEHALPAGVLSVNEARSMLGLAPLDDDRTLQSLNFVSTDIADKYQLARAGHSGIKSLEGES